MYLVVNRSTGIVVNRFTTRGDAEFWVLENNQDHEGNFLPLYAIKKAPKTA